ncbi:MAG: NAD-dependent deacetylase [Treponema sp.]|jgi:NAD-dependent deacetylase|nr:NAD-dependent deacetylase [Treponema sp.]
MTTLLSAIESSSFCVAFTGAGVSTLSGIPDFRGEGGLYRGPLSGGINWEAVFSIENFEKDPALFYRQAGPLVYGVYEPSLVHRALVHLEEGLLLKGIITQNIDMLHEKAGSPGVIELHGSPRFHYCLRCAGIRLSREEAAAALGRGDLPRCPRCGRVLKPALTFYGEPLPAEAFRAAAELAQKADLMLVLGTSLSVFPAAELPRMVLRGGGALIIINRQDTPLDGRALLRLRDLEESFGGLAP